MDKQGHLYFLSAGEPSGDLHASELIRQLKLHDPEAKFIFLGGDLMAEASESTPLIHYRKMAFMGFSEVIRNLSAIFDNLKIAKQALRESQPSCLILIDYPSFNLKLAKAARALDIPVYWYIPPKVWAWKEYRIRAIKKYIRRVFCIFPFEKEFYRKHGVDVSYVGNPSVEEVDRKLKECPTLESFCKSHNFQAERRLLALVPGSRKGEIRNNLPIMDAAASHFPTLQPVIAGAPEIGLDFYRQFSNYPIVEGEALWLMTLSSAALVTSGTATLECALAGTPQVVCYRANGSRISYNLMKCILTIPFVSLPNLIAGSEVIPELLVHQCTIDSVTQALANILPGTSGYEAQKKGYELIREKIGEKGASRKAAGIIIEDLKEIYHNQ